MPAIRTRREDAHENHPAPRRHSACRRRRAGAAGARRPRHRAGRGRGTRPRRRFCRARGGAERRQCQGRPAHRAGTQHSRTHDGERAIAGLDRRALSRADLERQPQERRGMERGDRQGGGRRRARAQGGAREARRHHGGNRHRRREGVHPVAEGVPAVNQNRLLVHVHGGGYVYNPGEAGTGEAALMAAYGGFKVISFDYRMPPDFPYPAAMDDAMAVWKAALKLQNPRNMAIFGTSTGGGMTLAMILRAKAEGLALPAAIAPGAPWSDLTETGDSYKTNEWIDNVLVSYSGYLSHAALLYANGRDLKDPQLSPIYGDFTGFPPAILTSGTRDLFLSLTVLTHRKLRRAG